MLAAPCHGGRAVKRGSRLIIGIIYGDDTAIRVTADSRQFVISEHDTIKAVLRLVPGLFLAGIGGLVLYVFLSGGFGIPIGGFPKIIFSWLILTAILIVMGILPFCWGLAFILTRQRFLFDAIEKVVRRQLTLGGIAIISRKYPLQSFACVRVDLRSLYPFGGRRHFLSSPVTDPRAALQSRTSAAGSRRPSWRSKSHRA